jgi:hypothetical protein
MKDFIRTGLLYSLSIAIVSTVLAVLLFRNGSSQVVFSDVRTRNVLLQVNDGDESALINETAPSRTITLRGFEVTYVERGSLPQHDRTFVVSAASLPVTLNRMDQLHIKDIGIRSGTRLTVSSGDEMLDLVFDGSADCCRGRIGVGNSFAMTSGNLETRQYTPHLIDEMSPNLRLRCATPPCSMSLSLLEDSLQGFIENRRVSILSFDKPGTAIASSLGVGESGILGGNVEVNANDLLGIEYTLRKVSLANGDGVTMFGGDGGLSLDLREKVLSINSVSSRVESFRYRSRAGAERDLLPSLLELVLREPWRPSLLSIFVGIVPALAAFLQARLASNSKRRRVRP